MIVEKREIKIVYEKEIKTKNQYARAMETPIHTHSMDKILAPWIVHSEYFMKNSFVYTFI